jgi:ubiquinone/menaquinone biosynthesis C-methylase UbiE
MERKPYNLAVSDANQYHSLPAIYDALMAGVPYTAWLARMERAARERGKQPQSVLDVACGTGAITEILWRRGYRPVVGFDIAPDRADQSTG